MDHKIAFLIPAHNEQDVIENTLQALLKIASPDDIYVVNDGSKDDTQNMAEKYIKNILNLYPNQGKASAINTAIDYFGLSKKYSYLMPVDADTIIPSEFIKNALPVLVQDEKKEYVCVIGKVTGRPTSWVTTYRLWEYEIAQTVHKYAQSIEDAIVVCPGCATIFRAEIFQDHKIPSGTLTEDMDFTFLIHRENWGKIAYTSKAVVITQDPQSMYDFIKQIDRWYTGFWQCLLKHNIPWGGQRIDAEIAILASEGLFNGIVCILLVLLIPITLMKNPMILATPIIVDLVLFVLPTMILTAKRHNKKSIFKYMMHFYLMRVVSSLIFLKAFTKVVAGIDLSMIWGKASRYKIKEAI